MYVESPKTKQSMYNFIGKETGCWKILQRPCSEPCSELNCLFCDSIRTILKKKKNQNLQPLLSFEISGTSAYKVTLCSMLIGEDGVHVLFNIYIFIHSIYPNVPQSTVT
jgi:hypothetical protein